MKILHVITGMRKAAGTSVFVGEIAREQIASGHSVTIVYQETWRQDNYEIDPKVEFVDKWTFFKTLSSRDYDVVHVHGMWEYMLHQFATLCRKKDWPYVWSPHGSITPWAMHFKWWKKMPVWYWWQRNDIRKANMLHVTATCEENWVRDWGFSQDCVIAPLGVHIGAVAKLESKIVLFVSRIHQKKGLDMLLRAVSKLEDNGYKFRIVGPDQDGYVEKLKRLARELDIESRVEFVGAKFGSELAIEYLNAEIFVLPTYSENFGSVVVEALAVGVPVVCTKGAPWHELQEYKCGWWTEISEEAIRGALQDAFSRSPEERRKMGARGRALVAEKYTWNSVANRLGNAYNSLLRR